MYYRLQCESIWYRISHSLHGVHVCVCSEQARNRGTENSFKQKRKTDTKVFQLTQIVQRHQIETEIPDNATYFEIESIFNHFIRCSFHVSFDMHFD